MQLTNKRGAKLKNENFVIKSLYAVLLCNFVPVDAKITWDYKKLIIRFFLAVQYIQ